MTNSLKERVLVNNAKVTVMQREKKLLSILLFIVASFATALHELSPHHHSESCQVCVVDERTLCFDIIQTPINNDVDYNNDSEQFTCKFFSYFTELQNQSRAPPLFS